MIGKELFTAFTFLIRERPQAAVGTFQARFAAYAGTFLLIGFFHAVRTWSPANFHDYRCAADRGPGWDALAGRDSAGGHRLMVAPVCVQHRARARHVVRTGLYSFVRHPVYAAYVLQYLGIWLIYPSIVLAAGIAIWFGLTLTGCISRNASLRRHSRNTSPISADRGPVSQSVRLGVPCRSFASSSPLAASLQPVISLS